MRPLRSLLTSALLASALMMSAASGQPPRPLPGEKFTPPARDERQADRLRLGDPAPDFSLPDPDKQEVKLSSFKGKKPVVLIFGSCT